MIIRPYEPQDQSALLDLILNIQRNEFAIDISAEDQPDLANVESFYITGHGNFWVALDKDKVIGSVALLDIGDSALALRKMFVAAEYRGKPHNLARSLLAEAINWAGARQVRAIYLGTTAQFLAAHRFYEKNGFREIEAASLPASFPVMKVDSKFYRLDL